MPSDMENWKETRQQILVHGLSQLGACEKLACSPKPDPCVTGAEDTLVMLCWKWLRGRIE